MNILFIGINFGNYEHRIKEEFVNLGHNVDYMSDTISQHSAYERIVGEKVTDKINTWHQMHTLKALRTDYDLVFVIVGRHLKRGFLENVKRKNPNARYVLYLWDDVKRVESFSKINDLFDEIYSFDLKDCREYGFCHLPLFYYVNPDDKVTRDIDIYSAMFGHSEREEIVNSISRRYRKTKVVCMFYICLGRYEFLKRVFTKQMKSSNDIIYISSPIDERDNYHNMNRARIVLDVQFSGQVGLTMRTIESIGMKNRLITTNPCIQYYDFYNPENIQMIDRHNICLDNIRIDAEYKELPESVYQKYSITNWVRTITGEQSLQNYIGDNKIEALIFEE